MLYYSWLISVLCILRQVNNQTLQEILGGKIRRGTPTPGTPPSVDLSKKQLGVDCVCDFTTLACDYLCCCDPDCPDDAKGNWSNKLNNVCSDKQLQPYQFKCLDSNLLYRYNERPGMGSYSDNDTTCFTLDNDLYLRSYYDTFNQLANEPKTIETIFTAYVEGELLRNTRSNYMIPENNALFLKAFTNEANSPFMNSDGNMFMLMKPGFNDRCMPGKGIRFNESFDTSCIYELTNDNCDFFNKKAWEELSIEGMGINIVENSVTQNSCSNFPSLISFTLTFDKEAKEIVRIDLKYEVNNPVTSFPFITRITFSVRFTPDDRARSLSGEIFPTNGGYHIGQELIFGNNNMFKLKGNCSTTVEAAGESILFGQNKQYSCSCQTSTCLDPIIYSQFKDALKVGKNKNSTENIEAHWIPIPQPNNIFHTTNGNIITYFSSMVLNFITVEIGSESSLQNSIVASFWSYKTDTTTTNGNSKFFLSIEIKFHKLSKSSSLLKTNPRLTTILPSLPTNLLEPLTKVDF